MHLNFSFAKKRENNKYFPFVKKANIFLYLQNQTSLSTKKKKQVFNM